MKMKMKSIYKIIVKGESISDLRAATPPEIESQVKSQVDKPTGKLEFKVLNTQLELFLNKGDVEGATKALKIFRESKSKAYAAPTLMFKRDMLNGGYPYIGAASFFGAFRDASYYMYPHHFYTIGAPKGTKQGPARKHLRKVIQIKPIHIHFYNEANEKIKDLGKLEGQSPSVDVPAFAYYETIRHPFTFTYQMSVNPMTALFQKFLSDADEVVASIKQSANHGIGGSRGMLYGLWEPTSIEIDS